MKREERYALTYINGKGETKVCYPRSTETKDVNLRICKEHGYKVVSCKKLYPFNTYRNQHNFELIANICYNTMWDMNNGEIPYNEAEYDRLYETRTKAEKYFCYDLPVAWVPWEEYKEMKELAAAAVCHRDAACARAREHDYRDSDWRPGDAPWDAPGMSARDFVR